MIVKTAPAKVILFGEHAVVYGQPAIAAPVPDLQARATVRFEGAPLKIIASDLNETVELTSTAIDNALTRLVQLTLEFLKSTPPHATIEVTSTIPLASGLGSGAAVSAALAKAITTACKKTMSQSALNDIVYEVEKLHHGTPSGIDNTVVVYERPLYYVRGKPIELFAFTKPIYLLIADTGKKALTRIAVGDVRKLVERDPFGSLMVLEEIGGIVQRAHAAILQGDIAQLGRLADENHVALQKLGVSSTELDQLVVAARDAGAVGAKLSGGGRGGNMIAIITPETRDAVERALYANGATNVIATTLLTRQDIGDDHDHVD